MAGLQLSDQWRMGLLVAVGGMGLVGLNARYLAVHGVDGVSALSAAAAVFSTLLGWALVVQPTEENV